MDCTPEKNIITQDRLIDLEVFENPESIKMPLYYYDKRKFYSILNTETRTLYMAKTIRSDFEYFTKEMLIDLHREIDIRSKISHPTIIQFVGYSLTDFDKKDKPVIVTEYLSKITLNNILEKDNKLNLTDTQKLINIYGIASGMHYLHSHDIILRNLQLESIFLDENFHPKISELNSAKEISSTFSEQPTYSTIKTFSSKNLAPEVLKDIKYSKSSDVYDFGTICFSIMMNKAPKSEDPEEVPYEVYQNLIKKCWSKDPKNRPSFSEILEDLKTNSEYIIDTVDKDEFFKYIKSIEESQLIAFNNDIFNQKLDEKINEFMHTFKRSDINIKLRGPLNSDLKINLNNYKIIDFKYNFSLFESFKVGENESDLEFKCRSFLKKIMNFSRHEIINFCREMNIISKLNHPSILKLIGYSSVNFDDEPFPTIIEEYCLWRNLKKIAKQNIHKDEMWDDTHKLIMIYGIAAGMAYLHSHNIIHRDLKPENISVDDDYLPKITGFQIAKEIKDENDKKSSKIKGSPIYLAPEIYTTKEYSKSSDVYAYALILYEIFTKNRPYSDYMSPNEIIENVVQKGIRPEFDEPIPPVYRQLIERCWSQNPKDRPTFDEIVHELRTNPEFITDSTDKEDYFEYIKFIDEFDITYEPNKQINELSEILSNKIGTFKEIKPCFDLLKMDNTETNDLLFNYNFIDHTDYNTYYDKDDRVGYFYRYARVEKDDEEFAYKQLSYNVEEIFKNGIVNFRREINIISQLNHPAILKFIGYNPDGSDILDSPVIITEYASEKDLAGYIYGDNYDDSDDDDNDIDNEDKNDDDNEEEEEEDDDDDSYLSNTQKLIIIYGIAVGMAYLHFHDIIHRDLKPENIFLTKNFYPKIAGFHIAKEIKDENDKKSSNIKGSPIYLAPEIYTTKEYSKSSDVYAYALILYEVFANKRPFSEITSPNEIIENIVQKGVRPKFTKSVPPIYRQLIERCWSQNPKDRPTFDEIVHELRTNPEYRSSLKIYVEEEKEEKENKKDNIDEKIKNNEELIEEEEEEKDDKDNNDKEKDDIDKKIENNEEIVEEEEEEKDDKENSDKEKDDIDIKIKNNEEIVEEEEEEKDDIDDSDKEKDDIDKKIKNNEEIEEEEEENDDDDDDDDYDDDDDEKFAFQQYLKYIDESEITFDSSKKIQPIENFESVEFYPKFLSIFNKINIRSIYKTEANNILFGYDFINLKKYKIQQIRRVNYRTTTTIVNKETGQKYRVSPHTSLINKYQNKDLIDLMKKININNEINHPSFLKYIGYSPVDFKNKMKAVIITEYASDDPLYTFFTSINKEEEEDNNEDNKIRLTDTNKLIIIYGIAAGLQYLHLHNIIHCDFDSSEILLDKNLYPKIKELEKPMYISQAHLLKYFSVDSSKCKPPEVINDSIFSPASDAYSFGIVIYEIITNELVSDFKAESNDELTINKPIQNCYRNLIEKCWSKDPIDRPNFDEIVYYLKTNNEFITDKINKEEFEKYIKYIESNQKLNDNDDDIFIKFNDYIKSGKFTFRRIKFDYNKLQKSSRKKFSINMGAIDINLFDKKQKIGSVSFCNVYKVQNKKDHSELSAKISKFEVDQCSNDMIENLTNEINILSNLNHSSIIKYIGFSPINFNNKTKPVILTEFASNGSLKQILELERNKGISDNNYWNDTKKLINIYGIAAAMKYLHENGILHRNLKPEYILLDDFLYPKIADFSFAKEINNIKESEFVGTYLYCAPEIIKENKYSTASDVYSFGLIMYEIMTNDFPFNFSNLYQFHDFINNNNNEENGIEFKCQIPYCYENLIKKCLNNSIDSRPSFNDIVNELEKDPDFITSNVNKDEYLSFISYNKNGIKNQEYFNNKIIIDFKANEFENDYNDNKSTSFLDLSNYEKKQTIGENNFSINKIIEKKTNKIYMCHFSMNKSSNEDVLNEEIQQLNHPSILKFIGYSPLDFKQNKNNIKITEFTNNGSLNDILKTERMNNLIKGWDDTKKMMNIYGIASAMKYLHSHDILNRCLNPSSIYLDDILLPKIDFSAKFYNSKFYLTNSFYSFQRSFIYLAPEVLQKNSYSKSSDVYSFAFVLFEILSNESPFDEINNFNQLLIKVVVNGDRPKLNDSIPLKFKELISKCWDQNPDKRPSFDEIVFCLKNDSEFITNKIDEEDFKKYVNYIDYIESNKVIPLSINHYNENSNKNTSQDDSLNNEITDNDVSFNETASKNDSLHKEITNNDVSFNETTSKNDSLHKEITNNDDSLNETANKDDSLNNEITDNDISFNETTSKNDSLQNENIEVLEFLFKEYSHENDAENTYKYACKLIKAGNCDLPLEYAVNVYKLKHYKQAFNYFSLIAEVNHPIARYYIALMKYNGFGCSENKEEAYKEMKNLSDNGIERATDFLDDHF